MTLKLIGLICLLAGLAAFFAIWMSSLQSKKTPSNDDSDALLSSQDSAHCAEITNPRKPAGPSLAKPLEQVGTVDKYATETTLDTETPAKNALPAQDETASNAQDVDSTADHAATTHLEIAHQFFSMGDFEGAKEMAELVVENPNASQIQTQNARALISNC